MGKLFITSILLTLILLIAASPSLANNGSGDSGNATRGKSCTKACYNINPAWRDKFTKGQLTFISQLSKRSKVNTVFIAAWAFTEMNGQAAVNRERARNHNWLNIGYFDSGPGSITKNKVWRTPTSAAAATYDFFRGRRFGASQGIQTAMKQIMASNGCDIVASARILGNSGWASSQYRSGGGEPGEDIIRVADEVLGGASPGCR